MKDGYELHVTLLSDGTFGSGRGLPGRVDAEVQYDVETGLPYVRGRVLKGLLVESCTTVVQSVRQQGKPGVLGRLRKAADWLFGRPGSRRENEGKLDVGPGRLPEPLREAVARDVDARRYSPEAAREALTAVRHQTAIDDVTGAPKDGSLRSRRVLLRETTLTASLSLREAPPDDALALLHACARVTRRGGMGRSRGGARLEVEFTDPHVGAKSHADRFDTLVRGENPGAALAEDRS
jgi:hypothetical protein